MITALVFALILASIIGASLLYAMNHHKLAYTNSNSEAALLLAEGGVNDELQYIAVHVGATDPTQLTSQPVAANGETEMYPGEDTPIKGRKSTVTGYPNEYFWVYSTDKDGNAWNGSSAGLPLWIVSQAKVDGAWRRVKVQANTISVFSLHAIFALASYTNNSNAIQLSAATVTVVGTGGTNGTISNSNSTLTVSNAINANTSSVNTGQFTNSNLATGGTIYSQATPVIYPPVSTVLKRFKNRLGDSDAQIWTYMSTVNSNNTGVYTYRANAANRTINTTNCASVALGTTTLLNTGSSMGNWASAGFRPNSYDSTAGKTITGATNATPIQITTQANHGLSTGDSVTITGVLGNTAANGTWKITKVAAKTFTLNSSVGNGTYTSGGNSYQNLVQTLIFEPGDYYFSSINLMKNYHTDFVIDPQAYASGGTPGQVRFWVYDPANGTQNDIIELQIQSTLASGAIAADPSLFRLYYSKDGKTLTLGRPSSVQYVNDSQQLVDQTGNFNVFGGIYAVTKIPGDTSSLTGTQLNFSGTTGVNGGSIVLQGSLLADKLSFQGPCSVMYLSSANSNDPGAGAGVTGGYTDGG